MVIETNTAFVEDYVASCMAWDINSGVIANRTHLCFGVKLGSVGNSIVSSEVTFFVAAPVGPLTV